MKKLITFTILFGILVGISYLGYSNIPNHTKGVDLSHHNPMTDKLWEHLKDNDFKFVYFKASEGGTWMDSKRRTFYTKAKKAGLLVGCYHFFKDNIPAKTQLMNFKNATQGMDMDLIPVIDFERDSYTKQSNFLQRRKLLKELNELFYHEYNVYPIIYCSSFERILLSLYMENKQFWTPYVRFKASDILQYQHEYILNTNIDTDYISDLSSIRLQRKQMP